MDGFHFFRCHRRQVTAPLIGFEQNFVRQNVEFFLHFTLNISLPAVPNTSPNAPLPTAWLMVLQARATTSINRRNSAGIELFRRCSSTRYWVRLTRFIRFLY